jgi:hypothetical protein
MPDW